MLLLGLQIILYSGSTFDFTNCLDSGFMFIVPKQLLALFGWMLHYHGISVMNHYACSLPILFWSNLSESI